jgi:uncharacterized membrane protein YcaP (DUF421 family)
MFFNDWFGLVRVATVGTLAYLAMVSLLRISGKRTLSKMNAFDLIVTVALGSTLANVLLSESVALAEGVLAFALLIGLQYLITWLSVRSERIEHLVKAEPTLIVFKGEFLESELRRQRVTKAEVETAIRSQGLGNLKEVGAVVLETDGTLTVTRQAIEP